ncbi:hypothetical protein O0L34_g3869 [Tuta absoluta]|nr:hypothetical protein O0L34_g3869 [Tuta absoluta]
MAATSLAEQLKRLTVPESSVYTEDLKHTSLLFEPKDAAAKDRDTFYEIGQSGLQELITLYEGFRLFEDNLFSEDSKDFVRAVQTKEVNQSLNQTIEKFLMQLSPYLLLESSHKALEWLVYRYHIHEYNQDAVIALILPYHETKIFIRFVQLFNLDRSKRWDWLRPVQVHRSPLPRQEMYNQCNSNPGILRFIAETTIKYVNEFGERASQLNTVFAFFCSTCIGAINNTKKVPESFMSTLVPTLVKALDSPIIDFRSSVYVILGFLSTKAVIKEKTLNVFIDKILASEFDLSYDKVLLINLMYTHQTHVTKLSEEILNEISVDLINDLCSYLKKLVEQKISIEAFTLVFLSSVLPEIQNDPEEFRKFSQLVEIFIEEVDLKREHPEKIIKCILESFHLEIDDNIGNGDESDIEFVEEEGAFTGKILSWYSTLLKSVETKYPEAFDKIIKQELGSKGHLSNKRRKNLSKVLGFKPAVAHRIGGKYLFENLNHINPQMRVEAVKYISKEFEALKSQNVEFVKDSLVSRLKDDEPAVVAAALEVPVKHLKNLFTEEDLTGCLAKILSKKSEKWRPVIKEAVAKFCSLDTLPVNQETVLALVPYLFPNDETSAELTWQIIHSVWGKKFELTRNVKGLNKAYKDNAEVLNQIMFKTVFEERKSNLNTLLDPLLLNKENTLDVCVYLLLKSCAFKKSTVEDISDVLNLLLESVENRVIVPSSEGHTFSKDIMSEFIILARQDKMLFETMEYIFSRIIEDMNINELSKPWCNVCESSDNILVRRLYEICVTGCGIPSYTENYSKLLQKVLKKCFKNPRERFEFIANVAFGHILYATDPKDIISPELQIRSLKLLTTFISVQEEAKWLYDSDVVVLMVLFNLNNPIAAIRQCVVDFLNALLWEDHDKTLVYAQLLKEILAHKAEVILDHEQILHIMNTILTQKTPGSNMFRKNCLMKFSNILTGNTPAHIKSNFLKILSRFNNATSFPVILSALKSFEEVMQKGQDVKLNIYESNMLRSAYSHINETTISAIARQEVWKSIQIGLKEYRECVMQEDFTFTSPCVLLLKQIDEVVFKKVPDDKTKDLVHLITAAGAFGNNPTISSAASKVMRKIQLNFSDFKGMLEAMLNADDPALASKKKKSAVSLLSYQLTETNEWKLGEKLLEFVQNKKKMNVDNSFVVILFQLLKKCLRFEEQSYVEYTKQLIISSLWYYCKKFIDDSDKEQLKGFKSVFEVDVIVQCIRGTQNPQTHHHALILLSHAAYMMPEQVLHHTMEIFTFMGTSVLRHDDAYSFQIITKIIETLVPILVKLDKNVEDYTEKELKQLQNRVVPFLRIFADVVLDVPEHRRLPLYKKLIETLGPSQFLWVFLGLLLETHIAHFNDEAISKKGNKGKKRTLAEQESPINRIDFGQSLLLEFPPEIGLENFIKLVVFIKSLPLHKDKNSMDTDVDPTDIFSVNGHSATQLRHYKYVIITFMNTCLASSRFIQHCSQATETKIMEGHYKSFIVNILTFIQSISKVTDDKNSYWKVMLHHSYDLLDHTNSLLSPPMFVSVIRGLLKHTLLNVRRKSMELLNSKIQFSPEMFENVKKEMYTLLPPLLDIVETIDTKDAGLADQVIQEMELNQQTALLTLKLLTRMLAVDDPEPFKPVLETITKYTCNSHISGPVMASVVLSLAELCSNLKAHALGSLRKFMPALIKVLKKQRKVDTPDVVLLSTITAVTKIVESLPLFLSPYLQKILYEFSILLAMWQKQDQECSKVTAIVTKLLNIKKKIASSIPPRVLIPVANETHHLLLEKEEFDAIGPVMSVLAESFANVTTADFTALQNDLTAFFLSALQLRSDAVEKNVDADVIDRAEDEVVNALVCLVLKLSETSFRPFYFKIYDWAIRNNVDGHKDRAITFYRLSSAIADRLKGLFVLFANHFIKNAADLLDSCNISKTEDLFFDSEDKCISLINYIIKTLYLVFLYDSQSFINNDRFETLMQPIVDQLENTLGGITKLKARATESIIPCISQLAVAIADDSLWKLLNYQILLKIRHNDAEIRLTALECLVSMATQLGSNWLPLLAESVPFLAELLEDGDARIEAATKDAIRKLEQILGEPLEKYF